MIVDIALYALLLTYNVCLGGPSCLMHLSNDSYDQTVVEFEAL
jgi:hypothetical protein